MRRVLEPELLDELDPRDPQAIRSRKDLRVVNLLMGNQRWLIREVKRFQAQRWNWGELGAGGGELSERLTQNELKVTGFDLAPCPQELVGSVDWIQGDFLNSLKTWKGRAVLGCLILHHFDKDQLSELGKAFENCEVLIFAEPLRTRLSWILGSLLLPFVGKVTRHDMMVSIKAGFCPGELPSLLGLTEGWDWSEHATLRGGLRSIAVRQKNEESH